MDPDLPLPEYPRPGIVRPDWLNLNGPWEFAVTGVEATWIRKADGQILVPFAIEAPLSGVGHPLGRGECLWYRRTFEVPGRWARKRVLLHFGAVDWDAVVFVNGHAAGHHRGGFDPFTLDITGLIEWGHSNELVVAVRDSTGRRGEQRGKQSRMPMLFLYTAVSGIWQTVWLEAVPETWIAGIRITPGWAGRSVAGQLAEEQMGEVRVEVEVAGSPYGGQVQAELSAEGEIVATIGGRAGEALLIKVPGARLWSPEEPFLYSLRVQLGGDEGRESRSGGDKAIRDEIMSTVGIRTFGVARDRSGHARLTLNGEPLFQYGPVDQGYWPDGLYTAPTDEALAFDVETVKSLGCNVVRKHDKIEPARWYHHCDRIGLVVWQDMPHGGRYLYWRSRQRSGRDFFMSELKAVVDALYNVTSIGMWTIFNEGWGQIDTRNLARWLQSYDPTRLVDAASGWWDRGAGDVRSSHHYPGPKLPPADQERALTVSEFGGLGMKVEGHVERRRLRWSYRMLKDRDELAARYAGLVKDIGDLAEKGLAGAVCTEFTDVEGEINGWLTYDREVMKIDADKLRAIHEGLLDRAGQFMDTGSGTTSHAARCVSGDLNPEPDM